MNTYMISAQFVNTRAKFDDEAKEAVREAVSNYNSKSLIAKNHKRIVDFRFSEDEMTLTVNLESEAKLPMPTKALRLLSSYLVEETCLNKYLSGKQLFKMTTLNPASKIVSDIIPDASENMEDLDRIYKLIQLRMKQHPGIADIYALIDKCWKES